MPNVERYPRTRDSGVAWLGGIPDHWEVLPGRACFQQKAVEPNTGLREKTVLSLSYGQIVVKSPEKLRGLVPSSFETYQVVDPADIVVRPTDLQNDRHSLRFGLSRNRGIITSAYMCLHTTRRMVRSYGYLLLHAYDLMKVFYGLGSGLRQNLSWADFRFLPCCVPTPPEQRAIVHFLEDADRRIRLYIRAKEQLISLLNEEKKAIVHQAVTGQIDVRTDRPYPVYQDSGVECLGEVPKHWEMRPFVRSCVEISDYRGATPRKTDSGVFLVTAKNIRQGWIDYNTSREFVAENEYARIMRRGLPRVGDLLVTTEAPLGFAALVDRPDVALAQRVIRFRLDERVLRPKFGLHAVLDTYFQHQLLCRGTGSTAVGIKASKLPQLKITCPPIDEQEAIVEHLATALRHCEAQMAAGRRQIELLLEYRRRLIADVVTGKLDVRRAAASLAKIDPLATDGIRDQIEPSIDEHEDVPQLAGHPLRL